MEPRPDLIAIAVGVGLHDGVDAEVIPHDNKGPGNIVKVSEDSGVDGFVPAGFKNLTACTRSVIVERSHIRTPQRSGR
jgi:hypothetical protein